MFERLVSWFVSIPMSLIVAVGLAIIMADFACGQFEIDKGTLEIRKIYSRRLISVAAVIAGLLLGVAMAFSQNEIVDMMNRTLFRYDTTGEPTEFMVWLHIAICSVLFAMTMIFFGEWVSKTHVKFLVWKKRKIIRLAFKNAEEIPMR